MTPQPRPTPNTLRPNYEVERCRPLCGVRPGVVTILRRSRWADATLPPYRVEILRDTHAEQFDAASAEEAAALAA